MIRRQNRFPGWQMVIAVGWTVVCVGGLWLTHGAWGWNEQDGAAAGPTAASRRTADPVTISAARRQAELLHSTLHTSLQLIHHRYYREDEGLPIPAVVLRQAFRDIEAEQGVRFRWLAVEGQAMNSDHQAQDEFERKAVEVLKSGQPFYEQAANGIFRRAGTITLGNACLKCHVPDRKSTKARTAGLIISIPVSSDEQ